MHRIVHKLFQQKPGATLVEYVLILGLIFVVILIIFRMLGTSHG